MIRGQAASATGPAENAVPDAHADTFTSASATSAPQSSSSVPTSTPARIVIIRHAEKPGDDAVDNDSDGPGLSPKGVERANALAVTLPRQYPHIDYIIATRPSRQSNRPVLTVTPLAQKLNMPIDSTYRDKDYPALANALLTDSKYAGKTVLVCWHHGKIPQLAEALGVTPPQSPWPSETFDRIWQIDFTNGTATVENLPENALPGDST